ncbi:anti-repressor SinI family protein [Domibacillus sp. A3M-37]|nr:anti-repressor SinI family protein [Domibacillus sp. A3M-37]MCP3761316.1 anti-repressor SinI family protein [Domibacillus sp. A3M-37]
MSGKIELDYEWIELMKQAKEIGLEPDDIRHFLKYGQEEKKEISI